MRKLSNILMSTLWVLTALSILAVGIYNIVDNSQACLWAWFLPAIVGLVASGYTAIHFVVRKMISKKAMLQNN